MIYLPDTDALFLYFDDSPKLPPAMAQLIESIDRFMIPATVLAELQDLYRRGKLRMDAKTLLAKIRDNAEVEVLPIDEGLLDYIPPGLDMHDSWIVGSALRLAAQRPEEEVVVLTSDRAIRSSGLVTAVWE